MCVCVYRYSWQTGDGLASLARRMLEESPKTRYVYTHIYREREIFIYIYIYVYMYVYICVCVYIYTSHSRAACSTRAPTTR